MKVFKSKTSNKDNKHSLKKYDSSVEEEGKSLDFDKRKEFIEDLRSTFKEIIFGLLIIILIFGISTIYTGIWPPIVLVESNSMMHGSDSLVGTMDTGDIVLSKDVKNDRKLIITYVDGEKKDYRTYNSFGDVISFRKNGDSDIPVIHRAIVWVEYNSSGQNNVPGCQHLGSFDVPSLNIYNVIEFVIDYELSQYDLSINLYNIMKHFGQHNIKPHSGFITKGDYNTNIDQGYLKDSEGQLLEPIKEKWLIGKAEGELPWLGLLKLLITGQYTEKGSKPPKTSVNMFIMCILLIVFCLMLIHFMFIHRQRKKRRMSERVEDKKAEMFQKLIDEKRDSSYRGGTTLITKQELDNFSENELLKYLEGIVSTGFEDKDSMSKSLTIYDLKELTKQSNKTQVKAQLKERFLRRTPTTLTEPEPSRTMTTPARKPVTKQDMMEIFNLLLELEFDSNIPVFEKPIAPMAKRAAGLNNNHVKPLAPIARPATKGNNTMIARPVERSNERPMAKPIAKKVVAQKETKKSAPMAKRADSGLLKELMDMIK